MTLEEIFKEYEKRCGNTCLDEKPSDSKECLDAAVRAVNRYYAEELADLRAENGRLREALRIISASVFNDNGDVTYDTSGLFKASRIAKEALK